MATKVNQMTIDLSRLMLEVLLFIGASCYFYMSYQRWKDMTEIFKEVKEVLKKLEGAGS